MPFKPGQTGNPRGRPKLGKVERLLANISKEELAEAIIARLSKAELLEILVGALAEVERRSGPPRDRSGAEQ